MPAASIEEVVRLKYGGIIVHKAVDTSPQRRVDTALMFLTKGAHAVPGKGSEIKLIFA